MAVDVLNRVSINTGLQDAYPASPAENFELLAD